jgi:cell division protein FtsW
VGERAPSRSTRRVAPAPVPPLRTRGRSVTSRARRARPNVRVASVLRAVPSEDERRRRERASASRTSIALLLLPTALLTVTGLVMVLSASSVSAFTTYGSSFWFFNRQLLYAALGCVLFLLTSRMRYRVWQRISVPFLIVTIGLLLLALHPAAGTSAYGASRWIDLGSFTLQPSELAKLALVAFAATVLTKKWNKLDDPLHLLIPLGIVVAVIAGIVILQRDLGTTLILVGTAFLLLFVAGVRLRYLMVTAAFGLASTAYLILGEGYRRTRLLSFSDPWADAQNTGYQLIQGLIALGSGGMFGVGLGASRQKWEFVPNAHTDFIFAILGEELGFFGGLVVLALFGSLIYAGIRIAVRAPDTFGRLLAAGITSWIGLQAIVNLGAVTGLLPITGVPLPLVSFGGTALIVTLAAVGVLASIARASGRPAAKRASGRSTRPSRARGPRTSAARAGR